MSFSFENARDVVAAKTGGSDRAELTEFINQHIQRWKQVTGTDRSLRIRVNRAQLATFRSFEADFRQQLSSDGWLVDWDGGTPDWDKSVSSTQFISPALTLMVK